jgi:hypothetical protein
MVTAGKVTLAAMATDAEHAVPSDDTGVLYRERLRTPWWWYPVGLFVAGLLAAEFHVSGLRLTDWIPFGVLLPLAVLIVWATGRGELKIADGEVLVRGAHLPLRFVSGWVALDARTLRRVVGREGDPQDPTPYWVISSRHPDRVVGALQQAR